MSWLSKISGNWFSASNENTLALANLKFDFSLMKVEAPTEFSGLGRALSKRRRTEAEDGLHHKTARKLAALFEQLVPSTPELIKAYGLRSSEIIQMSSVNPSGSSKDGPFEPFVGADGTAMWAAATSGIPALGVYLLACLLARAWDAKEATSIWVELVEQRRKEIVYGMQNNHAISESSRFSLYQDIQRSDLALWDSSARAWLRSADQAKIKEQTQLMLVVKNVQLTFDSGVSTYSKVINVWRHAMSGLENLLSGRPQEISTRSVLLAFSAWHLYPDLIVLGSEITKVPFRDRYVNPRGIGTIALTPRSESSIQGTSWSLALSHLRFYGDPITVESRADFSRVSIDQLHIVALGSLFGHWEVSQRDQSAAAQWFVDLWALLSMSDAGVDSNVLEGLIWLQDLALAAAQVVSSRADKRQEALQLLGYGQRRASRFLNVSERYLVPFFGLAYAPVLAGLSEEENKSRGLVFLRALAEVNGLRPCDAVIGRELEPLSGPPWFRYEYTTAVPHSCVSKKRNVHGENARENVHVRWRHVVPKLDSNDVKTQSFWSIEGDEAILLPRDNQMHRCSEVNLAYLGKWETIPQDGVRRFVNNNPPWQKGEKDWVWINAPLLFDEECYDELSGRSDIACSTTSCLGRPRQQQYPNEPMNTAGSRCSQGRSGHNFRLSMKVGHFSLFVKPTVKWHRTQRWEASSSSEKLRAARIKPQVLAAYLQYLVNPTMEEYERSKIPRKYRTGRRKENFRFSSTPDERTGGKTCKTRATGPETKRDPMESRDHQHSALQRDRWDLDYVREIAKEYQSGGRRADAIRAVGYATQVYRKLDGASISLKVVNPSLDEAPWLDPNLRKTYYQLLNIGGEYFPAIVPLRMPRENALSCIAYFETGTLRLPPEDFNETLAIASGNSIFVTSEVLSDPFDSIDDTYVKRIVGNIGQPGISMLIAPIHPRIRTLAEEYNIVNHLAYDGKRENNFRSTSLHLSFTDWRIPLDSPGSATRTIDQDTHFIESVISVLDSGRWVADLDILCIDFASSVKLESKGSCSVHAQKPHYDYTSIDNWEELLDGPESVGVFRAHKNWAARLAAVSILCQREQAHSIGILGPKAFCLECLSLGFDNEFGNGFLRDHESPLPSICID